MSAQELRAALLVSSVLAIVVGIGVAIDLLDPVWLFAVPVLGGAFARLADELDIFSNGAGSESNQRSAV